MLYTKNVRRSLGEIVRIRLTKRKEWAADALVALGALVAGVVVAGVFVEGVVIAGVDDGVVEPAFPAAKESKQAGAVA